ncbi:biotin/acetyl-CoA-carboxylase ligase [Xylanimonas cellulosilytica DSM 15894]|uniref:biotin--[biotin carboxyl-carrier protein] ligase n=1 Tax=Xylanimonas cellulosilytica (strain DSM 15894 / JCM 12276 / CECT 5975 / KCTC 9989 / LMG 20990 / NBRC 107835 / XIL07) TaxID=446471 RepID=D1BYX8_XYLCX|nr:biotin--[acetyl-CoA-carboxylase] ligase [Xylanimonas cellulosilytica]ACZ30053.1 biotin/acetyl-CoA-carboxylase ligase [Xylanimonas cellulosilytica DSM 15894]
MERAAIDVEKVRDAVVAPAGAWADVEVVAECDSTNTELARRAERAAAEGAPLDAPRALAAEHQSAGLGRAGRTWTTPPGAALTVSALLTPHVDGAALGWLPLLSGLAVVRALRAAGVPARLKWPNDVLLPTAEEIEGFGAWRKVGGVLAQVLPHDGGVVVGIGLNVSQDADELPVPTATSLALAGAPEPVLDRTALLTGILTELADVVGRWSDDDGDPHAPRPDRGPSLADEYAAHTATLGAQVRVELAGGAGYVEGTAAHLTADGALVVARDDGSVRMVAAGDVHHLRRA